MQVKIMNAKMLNHQNRMRRDLTTGGKEGNLIRIFNLIDKIILEKYQSKF